MEDQIKLFSSRSKKKVIYFCQMYFIFIFFVFLFLLIIHDGNFAKYMEYYIILGIFPVLLLFMMMFFYLIANQRIKKEKKKFTSDEIRRINREAAKAPKLENILITQDVVGYAKGLFVVLIPVRDIIWIRSGCSVYSNVVHSADMTVPLFSVDRFIEIRTRDNKVHYIPNDVGDEFGEEIVNYLVFTVTMKRPGVIIGRDEEWGKLKKDKFKRIVEQVDAAGEKDADEVEMLYNTERLYEICRSGIGDSKKSEVKLMAAIVLCYFIALFLYRKAGLFFNYGDMLKQDLFTRMFRNFAVGFVVFLPVVFYIISFIKNISLDKERTMTKVLSAVYFMFFTITVGGFVGFLLMANEKVRGIDAFKDWAAYKNGQAKEYEGMLIKTTSPVMKQMSIITEDGYLYFQGEDTAFKCYDESIIEPKLMQNKYKIKYTPNFHIIVSMTDSDGNSRVALNKNDVEKCRKEFDKYISDKEKSYIIGYEEEKSYIIGYEEENYGLDCHRAGDIIFPKYSHVQGYEKLTDGQKEDFDLLYSEMMQEGVESTRLFNLPVPLTKDEYNQINDLYNCNNKFDSFIRYGYMTDDGDIVEKAYVSTIIYSVDEYNSYSEKYREKAKEIAESIPQNIFGREQIKWICDYLIKNVKEFDYLDWYKKTDGGKDTSVPEFWNGVLADTGYGALFLGEATRKGYMEAFGMIADMAGIYTIAAIDKDEGKYWNVIGEGVGGNCLAVDVFSMANEKYGERYFMTYNVRIEKYLKAKGSYGLSEYFELPE